MKENGIPYSKCEIHPIIKRIHNKEKQEQLNNLLQNAKQKGDTKFVKLLLEKVRSSYTQLQSE
jgi:hypothetical protein